MHINNISKRKEKLEMSGPKVEQKARQTSPTRISTLPRPSSTLSIRCSPPLCSSSTAQAAAAHPLASASSADQADACTRPCFLLHSRHSHRRGFDAPASSAAAARPSLSRGPSLPLSPPSPRADVPAAEATDIRASAAVPAHPQRLGYRLPPRRGGTPPPSD